MPPRELNAVVSQKLLVTPELMIIRVSPDGWTLSDFKPGQYTVVGLPGSAPRIPLSDPEPEPAKPDKMILRAYSIASSSRHNQYLELYVTLVRSGALTPRLFALEAGDKVHLGTKITGMFTLDKIPEDANVVLMATGTGLAPYMSMIRSSLVPNSPRRFAVLHGAWHSWDLGYSSELTTLDLMVENFHYFPVINDTSREITPWGGEVGFVQEMWSRGLIAKKWGFEPAPDNTHVFLCGNPHMITDAVKLLLDRGFREDTRKEMGEIHLEKFW